MKSYFYVLLALITISCAKDSEEKLLLNKLESKFGASTKVENELFNVYEWKTIEKEIGTKFKNEIDKHINSIPISTNTDFDLQNKPSLIIDKYKWETPKIYIELKHSFGEYEDKQIHSTISLKVNNK
jgi:hypothetical protein